MPMSPLEQWAVRTVKLLMRDIREVTDPGDRSSVQELAWNEEWDALEKRLAIGLIQARAMACRDMRAELILNGHLGTKHMTDFLTDRSHDLERQGTEAGAVVAPGLCPKCHDPNCWGNRCDDVLAFRTYPPEVRTIALQCAELQRARLKHPGTWPSAHHGYAVILEELDELWDEVKQQHGGNQVRLLAEALQVSAMGMRFIIDILRGGQ